MKKVKALKIIALAMATVFAVGTISGCAGKGDGSTIKIGLLFAMSGPTAITEDTMYKSAKLAVDEINEAGGINGKKLVTVEEDYATDAATAAEKMKKLIMQDKVVATVGLYTSASRIAAAPVIEENNGILVYPTFYEGEKPSPNIVYTGIVPNQQGDLYVPWLVNNVGKKFFLLGTDTVYAALINKQCSETLTTCGGTVVGEELVPSGHSDFSSTINKIKESGADVIYCNLNGDSSVAFYKQYNSFGLRPDKTPIASFITDESMVQALGADLAKGHFTSVNYFNTVDTSENKTYLEKYAKKYGSADGVTAVGESSYTSVMLLAEALKKAKELNTEEILKAFDNLEFDAPQGHVKIDAATHHIWAKARIGKVNGEGKFDVVFESDDIIQPIPEKK